MPRMQRFRERGNEILDSLAEKLSAKQAIICAGVSLLVAILCLGTTVGVVASQEECAGPSQQDMQEYRQQFKEKLQN